MCVYYIHTKWKIPKFAHIDSYEFRFCISLVNSYGIFKLIHALNNLTILQRFVMKNVWKCTTTHYVKKLIWSNNCSGRSDDWVGFDFLVIFSLFRCWSIIGRGGGRQLLKMGNFCLQLGTAIHEAMHAAGFYHEQSRFDRDNYVKIFWNNIQSGEDTIQLTNGKRENSLLDWVMARETFPISLFEIYYES